MGLLDGDAEELKNGAKAANAEAGASATSGSGRKVNKSGLGAFKGLSKYNNLTAKYRTQAAKTQSDTVTDAVIPHDVEHYPTVELSRGTLPTSALAPTPESPAASDKSTQSPHKPNTEIDTATGSATSQNQHIVDTESDRSDALDTNKVDTKATQTELASESPVPESLVAGLNRHKVDTVINTKPTQVSTISTQHSTQNQHNTPHSPHILDTISTQSLHTVETQSPEVQSDTRVGGPSKVVAIVDTNPTQHSSHLSDSNLKADTISVAPSFVNQHKDDTSGEIEIVLDSASVAPLNKASNLEQSTDAAAQASFNGAGETSALNFDLTGHDLSLEIQKQFGSDLKRPNRGHDANLGKANERVLVSYQAKLTRESKQPKVKKDIAPHADSNFLIELEQSAGAVGTDSQARPENELAQTQPYNDEEFGLTEQGRRYLDTNSTPYSTQKSAQNGFKVDSKSTHDVLANSQTTHSRYKPDTVVDTHLGYKSAQTRDKLDTKRPLSALSGNPRKVALFLFHECQKPEGKELGYEGRVTPPITPEHFSSSTGMPKMSIPTTIVRMETAGLVFKIKSYRGRHSATIYRLSESLFQECWNFQNLYKGETNSLQTQHIVDTTPNTVINTSSPSSSGFFNNQNLLKTTTDQNPSASEPETLPIQWLGIDYACLANIPDMRFGRSHLAALYKDSGLTADEVQQSIDEFHYDVTVNKKTFRKGPLAVFMGILRVGKTPYVCSGYVSEEQQIIAAQRKALEERNVRKTNDLSKILELHFEEWRSKLTTEEIRLLIPDVFELEGPGATRALKDHFRQTEARAIVDALTQTAQ